MLKPIYLWDPNRQSTFDDIEKNISEVTGLVILGPVEGSIQMIPYEERLRIRDISYNYKKPLYIIVSGHERNPNIIDPDYRWQYTQVIRWPLFWLTNTIVRMATNQNNTYNKEVNCDIFSNTPNFPDNFDYTFICLSKRPKLHRLILLDKLSKFNLIKNNAIAYREFFNSDSYTPEHWIQTELFLDQEKDFFVQEKMPSQYHKSFMQIVPETDHDVFFLTEKTTVPMLFYKPFLVAGCRNYHKLLSEFGFQLYDELFDYGFDKLDSMKDRYEAMVQNLVKYNNCSKHELIKYSKLVKDKLIYNRNLAIKLACDSSLFPDEWNYFASNKMPTIHLSPYDINLQAKEFYTKVFEGTN